MKQLFIAIIILTIEFPSYSQNKMITDNFPVVDGKIVYSGVIETKDSASADELYLSAKEWISKT
ncbi:MAG: hypothetical protein ABIJ16_03555, partial [Bacteroidota bacterium]